MHRDNIIFAIKKIIFNDGLMLERPIDFEYRDSQEYFLSGLLSFSEKFAAKKIIFNDDVSFEHRMVMRGELQDQFLNYIFTFNSENDLIIRDLCHDSAKCRNN